MLLGLLGALVAALAYGIATIAQAVGVQRLAAVESGAPFRARLRAGQPYVVGLVLDGLGFLASVGALRSLPLFLVESAVAGSVAVTALLAVVWLHARLKRNEIIAIAATLGGLILLALSAHEGTADALTSTTEWSLLICAPVLGLIAAGSYRLRDDGAASVALAATCGLGFGLVGIAARTIVVPKPWYHLVGEPSAWSIIGYGAVSIVCYGLALHRGRVTTVAAITFAVETVIPAAIGLIWLGDAVRAHLAPLAALGFAATLGGSIALAAHAEPQPGTAE